MHSDYKFSSVLLVDDDIDDRTIFSEVLKDIDQTLTCNTASNGEDALTQLENGLRPDIIFLDLNMPRINGKQFLQEIKKQETLQDIPVIIYTTSSEVQDKKETQQLGASGYFTKPSNIRTLEQKLRKTLLGQLSEFEL